MGFFSKAWKGVKNVFKGVGKVVKKVFKEVKRFVKSDIGKFIIAAAAIYYGGQAMEWWGTGAESTVSAELGASTIAQAPVATPGALNNTALAGSDIAAMGGTPEMVAQASAGTPGVAPAVTTEATKQGLQKTVAEEALKKGVQDEATGGYLSKAFNWMEENPVLTLGAGNFLQGALAPDPYEERMKYERWMRDNSNIAGVYGDNRDSGSPIGIQGLVGRANQTPTYNRGTG